MGPALVTARRADGQWYFKARPVCRRGRWPRRTRFGERIVLGRGGRFGGVSPPGDRAGAGAGGPPADPVNHPRRAEAGRATSLPAPQALGVLQPLWSVQAAGPSAPDALRQVRSGSKWLRARTQLRSLAALNPPFRAIPDKFRAAFFELFVLLGAYASRCEALTGSPHSPAATDDKDML